MARFILARIAAGLVSIIGASFLAFIFMRLLPGNPARLVLGPLASAQAVANLRHQMGLDNSIPVQYWDFISNFVRGDWGYSYTAGASVSSQIGSRLPASIELGIWAFIFASVFALIGALVSTYRKRPVVDAIVRGTAFIGLGTPPFWLGLVLLVVFFSKLGWLPGPTGRFSSGVPLPPKVTGILTFDSLIDLDFAMFWNALEHLLLPAITLGLGAYGLLVRLLRANLLEVSHEPYLLVARSKGISRFTAFRRHALPNAFLPTLTAGGLLLAQLISGTVLVEKVFNWPGIGGLVADSIERQDFSVVQVFILLSACAYVAVNILVDILHGVLDPRIKVGRSS
jgi:ABC-type dipeptide/oligopeptide/nickel transport system permease component